MNKIANSFADFNTVGTMWIWFIPVALFTFLFSFKMVKYAEVVIQKTKFGGAFVGGALISVATSLTELTTEISQGVNGTPGVGLSDDLGANMFSTMMIALVLIFFIKKMTAKKLDKWTAFTIGFSLVVTTIMTIVIWFGNDLNIGVPGKISIGLIPIFFVFAYFLYIGLSYKFGSDDVESVEKTPTISAKRGVLGFLLFTVLLLVASVSLNITIDAMINVYNLSHKSAGGIFLSMTTAMPEIVSLVVLVKSGQPIAAIASIIGSHIFNLSLVFWGDLAYNAGPIIMANDVTGYTGVWILGLITAIELVLLLVFVIIAKKIKRKWVYAIIPALIVLTYIIGWIVMLTIVK